MKKRISIWIYGGVGTGHFSQGYPALEKLLLVLNASFEIVIYSQFATNGDYRSEFIIRSAPAKIRWGFFRWLFLIFYFLKDHRQSKFDLLFAFWGFPAGFIATVLSKIVDIPSAVYVLGSDVAGITSINFGVLHRPILRRFVLWTYKNVSLLFAISEFQKLNLETYGITRVTVIPWGVDLNSYEFRTKNHEKKLHFIHVGHLTPVKDQGTLLKAFALISKKYPAELRVYGEDFMAGTLQRKCSELGIENEVQFLGMIPYNEMPEQYAWADVMLHTSLTEGQSMALTEAAASGVLLAGSRVGLLHDLGDDGGLPVNIGDFEGLAARVMNTLNDKENWNKRILYARRWAETHDLHWTTREIEKNLNSLWTKTTANQP